MDIQDGQDKKRGKAGREPRMDANKKRIRIRNKRKNFSRRGAENAEKRREGNIF